MKISGETILITGASSGIGRALTLALGEDNVVIACARSTEKLEDLERCSSNIHPFIFDVTDASSLPQRLTQLNTLVTHIDRVIMNAGDCIYTSAENCLSDDYASMINVNFLGWVNTMSLTLELLKKSAAPHLIGISSQVIYAPFPLAGAYGASKAAASYFLSSARIDLARFGIDISIIHPGFVDTPLTKRNNFSMPMLMDVSEASNRIIKAIYRRKPSSSFPKRLRLILALSKVFPRLWAKKLSRSQS